MLQITGASVTIQGLGFINTPCSALWVNGASNYIVQGCWFGTSDGSTAAGIAGHGIAITGGAAGLIGGEISKGYGNYFVCCGNSSLVASAIGGNLPGNRLQIFGNRLGARTDNTALLLNPNSPTGSFTSSAVKISGCPNLTIGGFNPDLKNQVGGGNVYGLEISQPDGVPLTIVGNDVGCDPTGTVALPNTRTGILVFNDSYATIANNRVKFNKRSGIGLDSSTPGNPALPYLGDNYTSKGYGRASEIFGNICDDNGQSGIYVAQGQDHIIRDNQLCGNRDGILTLGRTDPTLPLTFPKVVITGLYIFGNYIGVEKGGTFSTDGLTYTGTSHPNKRNGLFLSNAYGALVGNALAFHKCNVIMYNGVGDPTANPPITGGYGIRTAGVGGATHNILALGTSNGPGGNIVASNVTGQISISTAASPTDPNS